jgi:hypothetical protein
LVCRKLTRTRASLCRFSSFHRSSHPESSSQYPSERLLGQGPQL